MSERKELFLYAEKNSFYFKWGKAFVDKKIHAKS